jgi:hypothetical protein
MSGKRIGGQKGYLLRLSPAEKTAIEKAAADAGLNISHWLRDAADEKLAAESEQAEKAAVDAERQAKLNARWAEIVECLGENSEDARRKGRHDYLFLAVGRNSNGYDIKKIMRDGERSPWPDINTGQGRNQIEQEASRLLEYHRIHHYGGVLPRLRLLQLFQEYIELENEADRERGDPREAADRKWADRNAWVKSEFAFEDDEEDAHEDGDDFPWVDEFEWPGDD